MLICIWYYSIHVHVPVHVLFSETMIRGYQLLEKNYSAIESVETHYTVSVMKEEGTVIGDIPQNLSPTFICSLSIRRGKITSRTTGTVSEGSQMT